MSNSANLGDALSLRQSASRPPPPPIRSSPKARNMPKGGGKDGLPAYRRTGHHGRQPTGRRRRFLRSGPNRPSPRPPPPNTHSLHFVATTLGSGGLILAERHVPCPWTQLRQVYRHTPRAQNPVFDGAANRHKPVTAQGRHAIWIKKRLGHGRNLPGQIFPT